MRRSIPIVLIITLLSLFINCSRAINEELRNELIRMSKEDQLLLTSIEKAASPAELQKAASRLQAIQKKNTERVREIVGQYGWPGKSLVGKDGAQAAWLLVQHADASPDFQRECLELMKNAADKGEASLKHVAYLTDRVLVAEGKKQVYGTQFTNIQGESVPLPIEDEAGVNRRRKDVGLNTLEEYKDFLNRQKKAHKEEPILPQLPLCSDNPEENICEVKRNWNKNELRRRLGESHHAVWQENGELNFVYTEKAKKVFISGGIQTFMNPLPGTDLWTLTVRIKDLLKAVIGYSFTPIQEKTPKELSLTEYAWRGSEAPPEPEHEAVLKGKIEDYSIPSSYLKEKRAITVYLPPGYSRERLLPVIYMTDGRSTKTFAPYVESMILSGQIPSLVIIGVHAAIMTINVRPQTDLRGAEYLEKINPARFKRHARFFMEEVMDWAEKTFSVSSRPEDRILFGFSNGAAFAISMALNHPDKVRNVICFSVAGGSPSRDAVSSLRGYFLAGTLEWKCHENARLWAEAFEKAGSAAKFQERISGHDGLMWREELPKALTWIF
jgi:enterochelin esterase-like enzyme